MNHRPPISSVKQELPFRDSAFSWQTFEAFFCDFLNAKPSIAVADGGKEVRGKIIRARPFGRPGDVQFGIDLTAEMEGGETWDFQCKHVKQWTPEQTEKAIAAYKREAPRRFLLVTCDVSEDCHRVIAENPGWSLWDAREINRRFRELGAFAGSPILFTHFGPGWADQFFGTSGNGPLIGAEAKYQQQLREGVRFHHRHALIGREQLLQQLDDFADDKKARVFLLIGRGGLGKSRLLLEWSRRFFEKHADQTLRFIFDKAADFGPTLQVTPCPLLLAFDDAHRLEDVRRVLFPELPHRSGIKLVLSLRPGPLGQVMQELLGAGFDTTEIIAGEPMKPLSGEQTMALITAALSPQFSHLRDYLRAASRDCPLIAVIGAELINSGTLMEADLRDADDVRQRVFESLLDDARDVRTDFGASATDDFLRLLALLGPVKLDTAFYQKAAPFLGLTAPDRVSRLRDALDDAGLLLTTGAGTRVTPDLLSDHLAYDACYDKHGMSRSFAERVLETFSAEQFPKLMQHLAEAEWRAVNQTPGAASIVEPLWQWFRTRFENSTFWDRREQLHEWMNIAHLQPERTLQLAELALSLKTAPARELEIPGLSDDTWNNHERSLEWLTQMLGPVAEHHPDYVARCFDLLWAWSKNKPAPVSQNDRSHPLSVINDVMTLKLWKRLDIHDAALEWMDRLLSGDEWLCSNASPAVLFERLFHPLFATSIGNNWTSGRTIHYESHLLSIERTAPIRERVRTICRAVLARRDARLAIQLIPTLDQGCDIARRAFGGPLPQEYCAAWDDERLKCLEIKEEMLREFSETLVHYQLRKSLLNDLRYDRTGPFHSACKTLFYKLSDTLDLRIARAAFGSAYDEFERDTNIDNWSKIAAAKWATFVRAVAEETHREYSAGKWLDHLAELDTHWRTFPGFQPNFRQILIYITERNIAEGFALCGQLLLSPSHPLGHAFDAIAMPATQGNSTARLRFIGEAANSISEPLRAAAVACCSWWRKEESLPEEAWPILETQALGATQLVAERLTSFVWWNESHATLRDWNLLTSIPFTPKQVNLASEIAARATALIANGITPSPDSVIHFINRFEDIEAVEGHQLERALQKLAEAFPLQVFLMLWRRNERRKAGDRSIKSLPYGFERVQFSQIMDSPEVMAIVEGFERRVMSGENLDFDELRLLRQAIDHSPAGASQWLNEAIERATTENHVETLRELFSPSRTENAALSNPEVTQKLLRKARTISTACHKHLFHRLLHVGGVRGSTNGEPDADWKEILENIERLAHEYSTDAELGPLYSAMVSHERASMDSMRMRMLADWDE